MSGTSTLIRLILSCGMAVGASTATAQTITVCSSDMSARLDAFIGQSHVSWKELSTHQILEGACDDGYFAEAYSEIVVHLLAYEWGDLRELAEVVRTRPEFYSWVIRHIDQTTSPSDLTQIISNTRSCSTTATSTRLCRDIADAAEQALRRATDDI